MSRAMVEVVFLGSSLLRPFVSIAQLIVLYILSQSFASEDKE